MVDSSYCGITTPVAIQLNIHKIGEKNANTKLAVCLRKLKTIDDHLAKTIYYQNADEKEKILVFKRQNIFTEIL